VAIVAVANGGQARAQVELHRQPPTITTTILLLAAVVMQEA